MPTTIREWTALITRACHVNREHAYPPVVEVYRLPADPPIFAIVGSAVGRHGKVQQYVEREIGGYAFSVDTVPSTGIRIA